jgi:hypothetical protein
VELGLCENVVQRLQLGDAGHDRLGDLLPSLL